MVSPDQQMITPAFLQNINTITLRNLTTINLTFSLINLTDISTPPFNNTITIIQTTRRTVRTLRSSSYHRRLHPQRFRIEVHYLLPPITLLAVSIYTLHHCETTRLLIL
jgi:hypothetical protein